MGEKNTSIELHKQQRRAKPLPVHSVKGRQKAEVVILHTSLGALPKLFFSSRRAMHLLLCKDAHFFVIDCNADLGPGLPDRSFIEKCMKRRLLPLDTDPLRSHLRICVKHYDVLFSHGWTLKVSNKIEASSHLLLLRLHGLCFLYEVYTLTQSTHAALTAWSTAVERNMERDPVAATDNAAYSSKSLPKIPQILIDGIPTGDGNQLFDLEEEGLLTPMLCGAICPRCGAPRAPLSDKVGPVFGEASVQAIGIHRPLPARTDEQATKKGGQGRALHVKNSTSYAKCAHCSATPSPLFAMAGSKWLRANSRLEGQNTANEDGELSTLENFLLHLETTSEENPLQSSISLSVSGGSGTLVEDAPKEANEIRRDEEEWEADIPETPPTQLLPPDFGDKAGPLGFDDYVEVNKVCSCDTTSIFSEEGLLRQPRVMRSSSWISSDLTLFRKANAKAEAEAAAAAPETGRKTLDFVRSISRESAESYRVNHADLPSVVDGTYCIQRRRSSSVGLRFSLASRSHCSTFASCLSSSQSPAAGRLPEDTSPSLFFASLRRSQDPDQQHQQQQRRRSSNALSEEVVDEHLPLVDGDCDIARASTATASMSMELSHPRRPRHLFSKNIEYDGNTAHRMHRDSQKDEVSITNNARAAAYTVPGSVSGYAQNATDGEGEVLEKAEEFFTKCESTLQETRFSNPDAKQTGLQSPTLRSKNVFDVNASESRLSGGFRETTSGLPVFSADDDPPLVAAGSPSADAPSGGAVNPVAALAPATDGVSSAGAGSSYRLGPHHAEHIDKEGGLLTSMKATNAMRDRHIQHSRCTKGLRPGCYFQDDNIRSVVHTSMYPSTLQSCPRERFETTPTAEVSDRLVNAGDTVSAGVASASAAVHYVKHMQEPTKAVSRSEQRISPTRENAEDASFADSPGDEIDYISLPHRSTLVALQEFRHQTPAG